MNSLPSALSPSWPQTSRHAIRASPRNRGGRLLLEEDRDHLHEVDVRRPTVPYREAHQSTTYAGMAVAGKGGLRHLDPTQAHLRSQS